MATQRWFGDLAKWMHQEGMSKGEVAKQSGYKAAHVLALFADPNPNPSLQLYLDLLDAAGARFAGVDENTPRAVVERLRAVMEELEISTSKLARLADVNRPQLSTLLNDPEPNPKLAVIDRIVEALEIKGDFGIVSDEVDEADEADEADGVDEADEDDEDDADEDNEEEDEADGDEADGDEADEDDEDDADDEDDEADDEDADEDDDEGDDDDADEDDDEGDEGDDDDEDEDDEVDDADEADDDQADDAVEQANQLKALQQQNAALQRQVQQNEAELRELKGKKPWWRTALEVATGAAAIGGAAYLVTRPPKKK